jgi:hypothetical protein
MTAPEKPPAPDEPAWKACEVCSEIISLKNSSLPAQHDDFSHMEKRSLRELGKKDVLGLMHCPHCHTFYLEEGLSDSNHWYSYNVYVDPLDDDEALRWLSRLEPGSTKEWLAHLVVKTEKS